MVFEIKILMHDIREGVLKPHISLFLHRQTRSAIESWLQLLAEEALPPYGY